MGGLPLRRELERVTDMLSNSSKSHVREPSAPILLPRTMVLCGSTVVMTVASMNGLGLFAVSSMSDCHWRGSPTNFCSCSSKSVCTRCSKLDGAEMSMRVFFFLENMMAADGSPASDPLKYPHGPPRIRVPPVGKDCFTVPRRMCSSRRDSFKVLPIAAT